MKILIAILFSVTCSSSLLNIYASSDENRDLCMNSSRIRVLTLDFSEATYNITHKNDSILDVDDGFSISDSLSFKIDLSKREGRIKLPKKQYIKVPNEEDSSFPASISYKRLNSKTLTLEIRDAIEEEDGVFSCSLQLELTSRASGTAQGTFWYLGNEGEISNVKFTLSEPAHR